MLLMMMAQVAGLEAGELVHVIGDCHIYDRHIELAKEIINNKSYDAPKMWVDPSVKDFYDFTPDDIRLDNYETGPQIKNIPIAV